MRTLLLIGPLLICYALAVWHMRYDWTYDASYRYGWYVLPLALYLFSLRWRDRPAADPTSAKSPLAAWVLLAASLVFGWLVREANPEWRLLSILFAVLATAASLLLIFACGGRPWFLHFLGAVLFFMLAVPWPSEFEKMITGFLMPLNASISEEVLHWGSVAATRQGNLISISNGTLGVEEACSGIRSLQATLMLAWFFGELYSLRWLQRLALFSLGLAIALFTNILRTVTLSFLAANQGLAQATAQHDTAGLLALGCNVVLMLLIVKQMTPKKTQPPVAPATQHNWQRTPILGPALVCAAGLAVFPVTELWYGNKEAKAGPAWHLAKPTQAESFQLLPISDRTKIMLRFNDGWSGHWLSGAQRRPVQGMYFEWNRGKMPPENLNVHSPGGCLSAIGIELVEELAPLPYQTAGIARSAKLMRFNDAGRNLFVLYAISPKADVALEHKELLGFDFSYHKRWNAVLQGYRNPGQRLLEIGVWDEPDEAKARELFQQILRDFLVAGELK